MASETKWLAIIVEVDTYDGEVQSVLPIEAESDEFFTKEELEKIHTYLKEDDDADFEFMWEFGALIGREAKGE